MDKASAYGAEDSRFDPWCGSPLLLPPLLLFMSIFKSEGPIATEVLSADGAVRASLGPKTPARDLSKAL